MSTFCIIEILYFAQQISLFMILIYAIKDTPIIVLYVSLCWQWGCDRVISITRVGIEVYLSLIYYRLAK